MVMKPIAEACGIEICAEKGQEYSFFSSPYQAHRDFSAVDIHASWEFGCEVASPVGGVVQKIMSFDSPTPTEKSLPEHLIIIKKGGYAARIMHVEPAVKAGEKISPGDIIGRSIANGFFTYWNDPTVHVEIRKENDYLRARGGFMLKPEAAITPCRSADNTLGGIVTKTSSHNSTVILSRGVSLRVGGSLVQPDGTTCLDYSGLFGSFVVGEEVFLGDVKLGKVIDSRPYMSTYATSPLRVLVNETPYEGIAFTNRQDVIKLLPRGYGRSVLKEGDRVRLEVKGIQAF